MKTEKKTEIDFLINSENYYLSSLENVNYKKCEKIDLMDISFYHIKEVSYEDKSPRKEALENVLSTLRLAAVNFVYLILGDGNGVHFYFGIAKNYMDDSEQEINISEIGKEILEPSLTGNFRGSRIEEVTAEDKKKLLDTVNGMKQYSMLEGVPGYTKEDEKFQGVDRLADVMMGDEFGFMIIASPLCYNDVKKIEKDLYEIYSLVAPLAKVNIQRSDGSNKSSSEGKSVGTSESSGENYSKSKNESVNESKSTSSGTSHTKGKSTSKSTNKSESTSYDSKGTTETGGNSVSDGTTKTDSKSKSTTTGGSESKGSSTTKGTSSSVNTQTSTASSQSTAETLEYVDKKSQDWIKYFDEIIMPRLDYGMGKGIFITTSFLFSNSKAVLKKLENTAISLYSGETGNKVPLRAVSLKNEEGEKEELEFLRNIQLPMAQKDITDKEKREYISRSALSQCMREDNSFYVGNWITTNELAMIAGLPQKEVVGLALKEEVEFGLNYECNIKDEDKILLGKLVQSGNVLDKSPVYLDRRSLDKHIFVAGVTGSGKTTTCQNILCSSNLPFLVIEPAKTEYRILLETYPDLLVFTLGNENAGTPFRLNPFEFFPHETITSRADMIKASIEAAFDMEAAIPQIIESSIYECYEDYGWDISTNTNSKFEDPFADGNYAFPTLQDLMEKVPVVVEKQGFDARLKNDYIGSIRARLLGLLVGAKGMMLNTKRSIDFKDLLDKRVVLELEEIRSGSEKSLIMGFVLTNLMQAIKGYFIEHGAHSHVTLVEEAHRLLSKFTAGDNPSKKQGVEMFSDMLAEIRKYGESLVVVDQIPNKLTPEVLKNTNTKIVHKLFAEDDKDAIGNTIVLNHEQKEFLSNLETGRAVVFSQGYSKAMQVQIEQSTRTDSETQIADEDLRENVYKYYSENYKKGIIINTQFLKKKPNNDELEEILKLSRLRDQSQAVYEYGITFGEIELTEVRKLLQMIPEFLQDNKAERFLKQNMTKERFIECREFVQKYKKIKTETLAWLLIYVKYNTSDKKNKLITQSAVESVTKFLNQLLSKETISFESVRKMKESL